MRYKNRIFTQVLETEAFWRESAESVSTETYVGDAETEPTLTQATFSDPIQRAFTSQKASGSNMLLPPCARSISLKDSSSDIEVRHDNPEFIKSP